MKKSLSIMLVLSIFLSMTGCAAYQGEFDTITPQIRKDIEDSIGKIPADYQEQVKARHAATMETKKEWTYKFLGKPRPTMLPGMFLWTYMGHFVVSFMDDGAIETENWYFLVHSGKVIDVQEAVLLSDSRAVELEKKYADAERRDAEAATAEVKNAIGE